MGNIPLYKEMSTKNTVFILIAIFAISINLRPAITSIGPMLEIIRDDLALSNTQVTLLTAIPTICMGVFASLSPLFNRKLGLKKTIYVMLILIGFTTLLRGLIPGYLILLTTAFIIGVAIAITGPLLSAMIKQYFPHHTASVIGVYSFGMGVGSAASAGATGVFFQATNSYMFALSIWSVLALLGVIAWKFTVTEQLAVRQIGRTTTASQSTKSPWKTGKAWLFLLFFGLQSSLFFSIIIWLVPIALAAGMTLLEAGTLLTLMTTVQLFLNIGLPVLMGRFPARVLWVTVMLIGGLVATVFLWTGIPYLMWIGVVLMGLPLGGLFPVALLFPLDETETAEEANSWTAMMQTGGYVIGGLFPLVIAFMYDRTADHTYTFLILILLFLILFVLTYLIGNKNVRVDKLL